MNKAYIKGFLEDIVLHFMAQKGESYGYEITRWVSEKTDGLIQINEGALYPVLHKLEQEGKLIAEFRTEKNRPRKYYRLQSAEVQEVSQSAKNYIQALQTLFS